MKAAGSTIVQSESPDMVSVGHKVNRDDIAERVNETTGCRACGSAPAEQLERSGSGVMRRCFRKSKVRNCFLSAVLTLSLAISPITAQAADNDAAKAASVAAGVCSAVGVGTVASNMSGPVMMQTLAAIGGGSAAGGIMVVSGIPLVIVSLVYLFFAD